MTANRSFDRELASWLESGAPMTAPAGLHDAVIDRARRSKPRPRWLVAVRGDTYGQVSAVARPGVRRVALVTVLLLLLLALAAFVVGALRTDETLRLGGNGPIAYTFQGTNRSGGGTHFVAADGSGDHAVTLSGGCPTYSNDGSAMVVTMDGGLIVTEARSGSTTLVPLPALDASWHPHNGSYAISPDGSLIAWLKSLHPNGNVLELEIWVTRVGDGAATRLVPPPSDPGTRFTAPVWSPDGRRLAFATYALGEVSSRSAIDVVDLDSGTVRRLTERPATTDESISWSPDSRFIAYAGLPDGIAVPTSMSGDPATDPRHDVFVVGADGAGERNLTDSPGFERLPTWSPGGDRIAYLSSGSGEQDRLTTLAMDGAIPAGAPVMGPAFEFVVWSPDGTRLLWADAVFTPATTRVSTTNITTLSSIDREFVGPSTTLTSFDGTFSCAPSWQRLDP
jgi:TolB protein